MLRIPNARLTSPREHWLRAAGQTRAAGSASVPALTSTIVYGRPRFRAAVARMAPRESSADAVLDAQHAATAAQTKVMVMRGRRREVTATGGTSSWAEDHRPG